MDSLDHLKYEEIQRYADEEDYSNQSLVWFEKVNTHMNSCEKCQKKLHQYLVASTIMENFNLEFVELFSKQYKTEGIVERVKQASQSILNVNVKDLLQGIEKGFVSSFSFSASRYPTLGIARGMEDPGNSYWIEWKEKKMMVHSKGVPHQYYVVDVEEKELERCSFETVIVQADETGEIVATLEAVSQDTKYTVRIFESLRNK